MEKKVVMVGIDGANRDILYSLIEKKELPFFTEIVSNGIIVENAVTCFPSTTVPCVVSMYTGCHFKRHNILNNNWFDRFQNPPVFKMYISSVWEVLKSLDKKLFGFPSILLPDLNLGGQINNEISNDIPTIYQLAKDNGLTSYAFFHYVGKGATKWIRPRRRDMLLFAYIEKLKKDYAPYEVAMMNVTINSIKKFLPDIISIYFGTNDGNSHRNGISDQERYLKEVIDPQLLRLKKFITNKYKSVDFYWAITADHGQTEFDEIYKDRCLWVDDFKNFIKSVDNNLTVDGGESISSTDVDVIFTFGNSASVGLYVRNRKTKNWNDLPDFEQDIIPILNTLLKISNLSFCDFKKDGFVDFILTRRSFSEEYGVYKNTPPYDKTGTIIELKEYFKDKLTRYIDPVERINGINSPKGPDAIIVLNYDEKKYSICKDFHKGNHGSLCYDDSYIPMIFSGSGIRKGKIDKAKLIDWAPTVAKILGFEMKNADGEVLDIFL